MVSELKRILIKRMNGTVLILVLLEDGIGATSLMRLLYLNKVLILVLLEDGIGE